MEVDDDIEAGLLRQFNCMNTSDKEVLIKEMQGLLGQNTHISEQSARFYLDMADWNLQAAICAYFDLQSSIQLPQMTFIKDVTIGEGESVPPNTNFIKTWRLENSGTEMWPEGCRLKFTSGERLSASEESSEVSHLAPRATVDISMEMVAPVQKGHYSSKWRMMTQQGHFFGDTIWVIIHVDDGGTLALMQQMVNLRELGVSTAPSPPFTATESNNPFRQVSVNEQVHPLGGFISSPPQPVPVSGDRGGDPAGSISTSAPGFISSSLLSSNPNELSNDHSSSTFDSDVNMS